MAHGHVFSQKGRLQASKQRATSVAGQCDRAFTRATTEVLHAPHGYDALFVYGALLGACAKAATSVTTSTSSRPTCPRHTTAAAADGSCKDPWPDRARVVRALPADRSCTSTTPRTRACRRSPRPSTDFDNDTTKLKFPFGIAGTSVAPVARTGRGCGRSRLLPVARAWCRSTQNSSSSTSTAPDWRQPKPGFNWRPGPDLCSKGRLPDARSSASKGPRLGQLLRPHRVSRGLDLLRIRQRPGRTFPAQSSTSAAVTDGTVRAFGSAGRTVLDSTSPRWASSTPRSQAEAPPGLQPDQVSFGVCDVTAPTCLPTRFVYLIASRQASADGPVLFYMRFFLHSIPEKAQDCL